jgi:alkyl sulfatase BDS1-like metallo-beta-lactamase superfamily hydrolase
MSNATMTNMKGVLANNPDLTITVNRTDLDSVMMGASTFDDLIKGGKAKFDGDRKPYEQLKSILVTFTPNFEILPGTATASGATPPAQDPLEVPELLPPNSAGD